MTSRTPAGRQDSSSGGGNKSRGQRSDAGSSRRDPEQQEALRLRQKLVSLLQRLPDIERDVLEARMGLIDGTPMKPGEVAKRLGLTINEVKKIETRAFDRIRQIGPLKGLEKFLGK